MGFVNEFVNKLSKNAWLALVFVGFLAACAPAAIQPVDNPALSPQEAIDTPLTDPAEQPPAPTATVDIDLDKFAFVPMLTRDAIRPIYDPQFADAVDSPLQADELVMGVAIQGEAKAYPVTVLRFREMVDDKLGGLPILVTW